jgi:deoxyribose-phosphate aldolase
MLLFPLPRNWLFTAIDLFESEIIKLCGIFNEVQVALVKTLSGYGFVKEPNGDYNYTGATYDGLKLMREHSDETIQIKAAGGVRTLDDLMRVRAFGFT